jgi:hypothetical protein
MVDAQTIGVLVTAASVTVAAIYYIMTLRVQQNNMKATLETRQAQMFMNIYQQTTTKEFASAWNIYLSSAWKNYDEFKEITQKKEFTDQFTILCMYFEGLGVLVKEGFLPIRLVALLLTGMTRAFWEKLKPIKDELRVMAGYVRWMSETEYLYDELLRYLGEHPELATEYRNPPKPK